MQIEAQIAEDRVIDLVTFVRSEENQPRDPPLLGGTFLNNRYRFISIEQLKQEAAGLYSVKFDLVHVQEEGADSAKGHWISPESLCKVMKMIW